MRCNLRTVNRPSFSFTVCTDRTDRQTVTPTLAMERENILSPLNEMQFTDCQRTDHHYYILSDRTYRMIDLTDCISASILNMSGGALTCL